MIVSSGVATGGTVYDDLNANGIREPGEPLLAGVEVHTTSGLVDVTNADGRFGFSAAQLAVYDTIFIPNLPHNAPGTLPPYFVYYPNPATSDCIDFGVLPSPGTASGYVFLDYNGNGIFDGNDKPVGQATVQATGQASTQTATTGDYVFYNLHNGDTIRIILPPNATAVTPAFYLYDSTQIAGYDFALTPGPQPVSGFVFWDYNGNGFQNTGEPRAPGIAVYTSSGAMVTTDPAGNYTFPALPNGDTIRVVPPDTSSISIPDFRVVQFSALTGYRFGLTPPTGGGFDLSVNLTTSGIFRPGFSTNLVMPVQNKFGAISNTHVEVVLSDFLQIVQTSIPPSFINGDTLVWLLGNFAPYETKQIVITLFTPTQIQLGTPVYCHAAVYPTAGDLSVINNAYTLNKVVVAAFDPNDKQVNPQYLLPEVAAERPSLEYTVRFQNTGNYPADFVVIRDTLSADLEPATFRLLAASHPCSWEIQPGKILVVTFSNINLPDSLSDEPGSHGFVKFSARPAAAFPLGHIFQNAADIYFDFNDPVRTNTATTQVVYFIPGSHFPQETRSLSVRPNPVAWTLYASWRNPAVPGSYLQMYDLRGLPVYNQAVPPGHTSAEIDVAYMQEGLYLLVYETPDEVQYRKVTVQRAGPVRREK